MSRDVITVDAQQSAESALAFCAKHDLRTAPVVDERRRVVGMVRRAELQAGRGADRRDGARPLRAQGQARHRHRGPAAAAVQRRGARGHGGRRATACWSGVITQTDLLAVLYRAHIVEAVVGSAA